MRVLHLLDHGLPTQDGYVYRTLGLLQGQRAHGIETHHLTSPRQAGALAPEELLQGWQLHRTAPPATRYPPGLRELAEMRATARRLAGLCARVRPQILQAHSPLLTGLPALWVGRRLGIPVVYEVRALWEDAAVDQGTARSWGPRYRATRQLETMLCRRADAVTTICEGLRQELLARGLPPAKLWVAPNAVDRPRPASQPAAGVRLRQRFGLEDALVLGFIGSFYAYEGLALLLQALSLLRARHDRLRLLLVGGGEQAAALQAQAATLGLGRAVVFAGRVPHEEVAAHYAAIDICVYPRLPMRLTELVTPLKPLEAMAHGRLVVASDVGGHRELIAAHQCGLLFRAGDRDALVGCLDHALAARAAWPWIIAQAHTAIETRDWPATGAIYRRLFQTLLSRPAADPAAHADPAITSAPDAAQP